MNQLRTGYSRVNQTSERIRLDLESSTAFESVRIPMYLFALSKSLAGVALVGVQKDQLARNW